MKIKLKKPLYFLFILIMAFSLVACNSANNSISNYDISNKIEETAKLMEMTITNPEIGSIGGDWTVMSLARSGVEISPSYFENYYNNVVDALKENNGVLHERKYTEYSRVILALTAIGKDPTNVEGYNLVEKLGDYEKVIFQGINGPTFALLALDSYNYEIPKNPEAVIQGTREMYIENILQRQLSDGGFSISGEEPPSDPDMTGMVLQALSKYKKEKKVKDSIDKALICLSNLQLEDGGYSSWGAENSESVVQVIMALTELEIDPHDERFIKNENTLLDNLMTFYVEDGGFMHIREGEQENGGAGAGVLDPMATDQGMYGLVAYNRFINNEHSFYNMTDRSK